MKRLMLIVVLCLIAGSCASEPPPESTPVPADTLLPTATPLPASTPSPRATETPPPAATPELSEADMELLAVAWRSCLMEQVHLEEVIAQFNSDPPPNVYELGGLELMPSTLRDYLRDEAEFPPQFEDLRDRIVAELEAIVGAIFFVTDFAAASEELATRRDNLQAIQLEIEKIVPEETLWAAQ